MAQSVSERNIDLYAARLGDGNTEPKSKVSTATDLRDNIEQLCTGSNYPTLLKKLLPIFTKILEGAPVFNSNSWEQRLRNAVLEILHRLPMSPPEALKPHAAEIIDLLMGLVKTENEDNAILCMKTIMDLQRHQPEATASKVQPFLDLIQDLFETMDQVVRDTFDTPHLAATTSGSTPNTSNNFQSPRPASPSAATSMADLSIDNQAARPLLKGMQSFKVLAECPIIVVSLFQAHKGAVSSNVRKFVPLIKGILLLQARPQERAHQEAKERKEIFTGVSKEIRNRAAFGEFITAQVKTMSFLAYLLRVYSQQLQDFMPLLPDVCVRILRDCPSEKSATRKELLVAIRHIVNFNYRQVFYAKVDDLLDERTLIGDGLTVYETMRPLAYSMLADLIHHVRDTLTSSQIRRTIEVFSKNLLDDFPGTSFQTMSAKLLLNMAERIAKLENKADARHYLIMILNAISDKFAAMNREYTNAVKLSKAHEGQSPEMMPGEHLADADHPPDWDEIDIFTATPIKTSIPRDRNAKPVDDNKFLFKNLINGLKNTFYQLRLCGPDTPIVDPSNAPSNWSEVSTGYTAEEVIVITKLFHEGARVFRYYRLEQPQTEVHYSSPVEYLANLYTVQCSKEEKDLLETFATVFHGLDPATFHEVFHSQIPLLYDMMFEHTALLHIPQFFLAVEATSPSFAGMLLQFLMDKIEQVGTSDVKRSSILLRMFKLSFMAVTLFSHQNEPVLLPHVTKLVTKAIRLSTLADEPMNYFYLLRSLFRSIGGGRFEALYKEILPLLEMLLDVLNNLLAAARKPQERHLYVELCLTVPARLSNLLPHLSYLMRPLVVALRADSELVGQGLRTLELCVDNLTADYLDPIMAPVIDDLMGALWDHLKPTPYNHFHAHSTMRILGKLGGRNRKFLNGPPRLEYRQYADDQCSFDIRLMGTTKDRAFPSNTGIELAITKLQENPKTPAAKKSNTFYKQQAFRLVTAQIKVHIGYESLPDDFARTVRLQATRLAEENFGHAPAWMDRSDREKSIAKKDAQEETLKRLLKALVLSTTIPILEPAASSFLADICRHFVLVEVGRALAHESYKRKGFNVKGGEGPICLDSRILTDVLVDSLSSDSEEIQGTAESAIKHVYEAATSIFGSKEKAEHLPFFTHLAKVFCHKCHEEDWYVKGGGGRGIHVLLRSLDLSDTWFSERQADFIRALFYVVKDTASDLPARTRNHAQKTLDILLRRCTVKASKTDLTVQPSRLFQLCAYLIYELPHMSRPVRETAQRSFATVAEVLGVEVYELVEPVKDRMLQPIFNKPLRAMHFPVQIGYIDAITYCLKLQHGILEFNDQMNRLLLECLALTDSEDELLAQKPNEYRTAEYIVELRVACIRLLSAAISFPDFANRPENNIRHRIISVFFKSLYSKSPEVIEAANVALKVVLIPNHKLPKELLQNGLRPILMNLQDPRKLSVPSLEGLARLLSLLTTYFKVEIGDRLILHMEMFCEPMSLQKISFTLIEQNPVMKIIVATLNVFHLLPPSANTMMRRLILRVMDLEQKLRRTQSSPFRKPLFKYLNRYAKETWDYFSPQLAKPNEGRFFAQVLQSPDCGPVRDIVKGDLDRLLKLTLKPEGARDEVAVINGIHIIQSLSQYGTDILTSHAALRPALIEASTDLYEKIKSDTIKPDHRLAANQAVDSAIKLLVRCLENLSQEIDFLFQMIEMFVADELRLHPSFIHFIYEKIVSSESIDYWRSIATRCLDLWNTRGATQKVKAFAFHYLFNPILAMDIMRGYDQSIDKPHRRLVDKGLVEAIHNKIWKPQLADLVEENSSSGVDTSRLELLQMSAMLLKYHHGLVSEARKDIIKFGWNYIRLEDTVNKHAAYVLIGYFLAQFESPSKIVNQIYVALLRAHQNEGRALVIQALDLMAPVLPKRLQGGDPKFPMWARWPKRILTEENSNLQQLISILQFMVRHPDLFYEAREQFIPIILPSLSKIAPPPTPSNDNKKLVARVIEIIYEWEKQRLTGTGPVLTTSSSSSPESKKRRLDGSAANANSPAAGTPTASVVNERNDYQIPTNLKAVLMKYLAQLISTLPERYPVPAFELRSLNPDPKQIALPSSDICRRFMGLFWDLLSLESWKDLEIDLYPRITESALASERTEQPEEKMVTCVVNTLQIVRIIINKKSDEWVLSHLTQIKHLLEKSLKLEHPEIQDCIHAANLECDGQREIKPLLRRVLEAIPQESGDEEEMEVETPATEFTTYLTTLSAELMSAPTPNYISSIDILWTICQVKPALVDGQIAAVMRALQSKLMKDHITAQSAAIGPAALQALVRPGEATPPIPEPRDQKITVDLILKSIDLISRRMSILGEQRRPFLSALASLVERSQDKDICERVLSMVEAWIFDSQETYPTLKEKTAVLQKMLMFEQRSDPTMLHKFLDLVIRIYEDPKVVRTELTVRLEHAFLVGTRAQDVDVRNRFLTIFDRSLTRTSNARLIYVLTSQNWDTLGDSFWLSQAIHLIFGSIEMGSAVQLHAEDFKMMPPNQLFEPTKDPLKDSLMLEDQYNDFMSQHRRFYTSLADVKARDLLEPLVHLQHTDPDVAYQVWVALFPLCWATISREDRIEMEKGMVSLLSKDFHIRQLDRRPNVVQALLEGCAQAKPRFKLPPHVLKFIGKTYDAWYTAAYCLEESALSPVIDTPTVRESNLDALVELYAGLQEDDLFYGTWRRRCKFTETNAALSYEQNGMWDKAQQLYEAAQIKARTGAVPFSQGEYMLWEDHWVICAQKLQQWDILSDFAKHENFNDLLLESSWRSLEIWQGQENLETLNSIVKGVSDAPTPRRTFFQAFLALLKLHEKTESLPEFNLICDEAIQLSIRKWHQLPSRITNAHIPILQNFQQLVELHDAQLICASLAATNQANLDQKSQELKLLLGSWRDRLPNVWDDINAWQDLVTWRQHIFALINKTYLALLPPQTSGNPTGQSFAYRGYHETAWIINRFAHVARKHQLPEVCISQLSRIYTLPNIEIQEAFLKLREQAKCHYQNSSELATGLDVINNTNLNYFGTQQKAEFFTLKGMFLAKLDQKDEANDAFGTALSYEIRLPKAWAEWGYYNDTMFKAEKDNMERAAAAVSCYLEAAGLFKNAKSRKLLSRILWLLSVDTAENRVSNAFEEFKGETPVWYWITFVPQLLTSLNHREARLARSILVKIAKQFPQALYFQLRTTREDLLAIKKAAEAKEERLKRQKAQSPNVKTEGPDANNAADGKPGGSRPGTANAEGQTNGATSSGAQPAPNGTQNGAQSQQNGAQNGAPNGPSGSPGLAQPGQIVHAATDPTQERPATPKKPWEHSEEIMSVLKTAFPLLALSMETLVDQVQKHFKCPPDEDAYRLIVALLNDGLSYIGRMPTAYAQDYKLPPATETNIRKFAETILPPHIRTSFEEDFVAKKPTMYEYIHKLRKWRDKFEEKLDRRSPHQSLESMSTHLSEFKYQKFDEVEVPGQYLLHRDKNQDFVRIDRFLPDVDLVRSIGFSHRRLKIRGHDGSLHPFAIQHPAARHSRREERTLQLFRIFDDVLAKRKESRRRNLKFHLPLTIPLAPAIRLVQESEPAVSLQSVYEDHCRRHGGNKDAPVLFTMEKLRAMHEIRQNRTSEHAQALRLETYSAIQEKFVPNTIALEYFQAIYPSFADFWLFRKTFSYQFAALTFMTYIMHIGNRFPHKLCIAKTTGSVWGTELIPLMGPTKPQFGHNEPVPFRLTPNLQALMGPLATEGIFSCGIMAIARCLTEPEFELEQQLSIFVRDEVMFWLTQQHRNAGTESSQLRETVSINSEIIVKKATSLAMPAGGGLPANQTVIDLISRAVRPENLAGCDALWMAYL
ncbi:hypothetical protein MMC25_004350 [Agyrium rufum]|nr:hypothetical protein [Agyrium rufum]